MQTLSTASLKLLMTGDTITSVGGHVLDEGFGFVKEGNLLFGVHISVTSPLKVPTE